jgi:hypothetical protein
MRMSILRRSSSLLRLWSMFSIGCALADSPVKVDSEAALIRRSAEENSAALVAGKYDRVVDFTFPKVVEMIGGRKKMVDLLRQGTEEMKTRGSRIQKVVVTEPTEIVRFGSKKVAVVPTTILVTVPEGTLRQNSFLLAISTDEGKTWTFLDGAGISRESLDQLLPDFPSTISLPAKQLPVLDSQ